MKRLIATLTLLLTLTITSAQTDFDAQMRDYGLVDIASLDATILVELRYSTEDNFVGVDMYGDLERAYFVESFARKVVKAQQILRKSHPELTLLIYDAARPISVQRAMRRTVEGTQYQSFVADGTKGGRHNYGVAVDLTLATLDGTPLDMGAGFDDFTTAAYVKGTPDNADSRTRTLEVYRAYAKWQVKEGIITAEAMRNRLLLIEVMLDAGLYPYRREWWHFEEIITMSATRERYRLLDF